LKTLREWVIVGATGGVAAAGAWWYLHASSDKNGGLIKRELSTTAAEPTRTAFIVPMRNSDGSRGSMKLETLLPDEINRTLREHEQSTSVSTDGAKCLVQRYDTNALASNAPIEDRNAQVIVQRDSSSKGADQLHFGDLGFFAVMDGHAGWQTSALLSQKLIPLVAVELDKVIREAGEYGQIAKAKATLPAKLWRSIFGGPESVASSEALSTSGLDGDPEIVKRAIGKAFRSLDKEIVNRPLGLLKEYEMARDTVLGSQKEAGQQDVNTRRLSTLAHSIFPLDSAKGEGGYTLTQRSAYETMLPALSGSCALLTYIDTTRGDIYVACTGDSRAVAGWYDKDKQRWEVEPLSKDQTGRNEEEARRMRGEHPSSEAENVIMNGRVLGGLEPTRAFGDARYKWDRNLQERLYRAFLPPDGGHVRGVPRHLKTPPYVTADPVVEWRRLAKHSNRELKFIIMATDGLWDDLSSQDAVGLVAAHLSGQRGTIGATELREKVFKPRTTLHTSNDGVTAEQVEQPSAAVQGTRHPLVKDEVSRYVFEDENLATHLTRNALGGANRERVAALLAIPAPQSRRFRDDITVNVILFNQPQESTQQATPPKAKL
jgi:pyruvate dehydrogenase phosphatase